MKVMKVYTFGYFISMVQLSSISIQSPNFHKLPKLILFPRGYFNNHFGREVSEGYISIEGENKGTVR